MFVRTDDEPCYLEEFFRLDRISRSDGFDRHAERLLRATEEGTLKIQNV
jgi:hypothetical protein